MFAPDADRRTARLPQPDPDALAVSRRLQAQICAQAGGKPLRFDRFMELALYAPGLGYYAAGSRKFGPAGDFVTAPELSPLFSLCVAHQCAQVLTALGGGDVLEFGAGSGALAVDAMLALERQGVLPGHYLILEVSPDLQERQRARFLEQAPHLLSRVIWCERLPERFEGVMLGNEVLDAMPVRRFRLSGEGVAELGVRCTDKDFAWETLPAEPRLSSRIAALTKNFALAAPYESEIGFAAEDWVRTLGQVLTRGAVLLFDYGFPAREFYHPHRTGGTLMCHYRHRAHGDPFLFVGLQDLTAHVDFTAIAEAAHAGGLRVAGYTTQANFLIATGLLDALMKLGQADQRAQLDAANAVKKLTLPSEMGELFKVMALTRDFDAPLLGFARDERARL